MRGETESAPAASSLVCSDSELLAASSADCRSDCPQHATSREIYSILPHAIYGHRQLVTTLM